jgi:hypothetical protein
MLCVKCNKKKAEISLPYLKNVCKNCFLSIIEKRVRKHVRINKLFKKKDRILVIDDLSYYFVKKTIKNLPVKILKNKFDINKTINYNKNKLIYDYILKNKINKIIIPWTIDDEINLYLEKILFRKEKTLQKQKIIKLFVNITDNEIELFSKFKKIEFKMNKKNKLIKEMIDNLEKKYSGIRFNCLKFIEKMKINI